MTKYYSLTGHLIGASPFFIARKTYDELPPHVQVAVFKAGAAATEVARNAQDSLVETATAQLKEHGIEFFTVDNAAFKEKALGVYEKYADQVGGMALIDQVAAQ